MNKGKKILLLVTAAFVICIAALGILLGISGGDLSNLQVSILGNHKDDDASNPKTEATATDGATLRELLAADSEIEIHVTEDMEVEEGFVVNGIKTLIGDANLRMSLGAELGQALLMISEGSSLTLDGPMLDCNFNSDGIRVEENATLTCLSGTIKYAGSYGILAYGDVTIKDVSIEDCEYISICAQTGSEVRMEGGSVERSAYNDVYVVTGAYMNISGSTVMEGADQHGMINYGTLEIHDGKFGNVNNYLCDNYGELTVSYEGKIENGAIEFYGTRNSVFLIRKGSVANISDVYIHDTQRQGIASLGGDTTISNCKFENTGNHSIDIQAGEASVENVTVIGSKGSGLESSNGSVVKVTNFTVDGCEKIGIASRGTTLTATNVNIKNAGKYGITCGDTKTGQGVLTVEDAVIQGTTTHGIYVYEKAEAELKNIEISDGEARGIYVAKTAKAKFSGKSTIKNMAKGGVEVRGELTLDSVVICDNNTKNSGAGVYVADGGKVTMKDGAVYNNTSELRGGGIVVSDSSLTINGTKIYDNKSANHGGGLYAQKAAVVNLNSGEIKNNKSETNGDGIYILSEETKVTMGENFYLGGNDVKLDNVKAVLHISGNNLKKHSASDPLLLTPNYNAAEGTQVAVCKNDTVAKRLSDMVKSGDGSYNVVRDNQKFAIEYTTADMDMTGADTVYVTNFQELKEAVLSTTSKRYIVLKADIAMEERIRVPGGVTICVKDDGAKRTLTRANGFTDSFFVTHYGTGLYLTGTDAEKLVLDGGYVESADTTKNQSLIRVSGSTELKNVVLQNNGSSVYENQVRGALVRQLYGDFKIYDSVLAGGNAYTGGALMIDKGEGYIEGSIIKNNESTIGGGAIRVAGGCELEVVSTEISGNHANSTGGGIVAVGGSHVTVKNTKFENNTAASYGGALSAQDEGTRLTVIGTDSASAIFKNNSSKTAGAIYLVKKAQLEVSGYTFENNSATGGRAGAISVIDNSSATIKNTAFYGNKATASGGALVASAGKVDIVSCEFGKENAGNEAGERAGAISMSEGSIVTMTTVEGGKYNSLNYNVAGDDGGAIYLDKESTLTADGYIFTGNKGTDGGAIYVAASGNVECSNNEFRNNKSTTGNGGAIYCAGTVTDAGSSYYANEATRNGGAIIVMSGGKVTLDAAKADATMEGNIATLNGGAIYVNNGGQTTVTGYVLESNVGNTGGAIAIIAGGKVISGNNQYTGNMSKAGNNYANAGAIYCAGTYEDTDSTYTGNTAKNGGAIFTPAGGKVTLIGTNPEKAIFENNNATGATNSRGGALFLNNNGGKEPGSSISVTGYTFKGNTSTGTSANTAEGAIQALNYCSVTLTDVTFEGNQTQKTYVGGTLTLNNLSGALLVAMNSEAEFVVDGYKEGNAVEITPYNPARGNVVLSKTEEMKTADFEAACSAFTVSPSADGTSWYINKEGKLVDRIVANIKVGDTTQEFTTLKAAVDYANENGSIGEAAAIKIVVLENVAISEKLNILKNMTIINAAGEEITISRGTQDAQDMFVVAENATLTLGTNDKNETGKLIVDGATTSAIAGRTVTVNTGAGFVLAKNATLQNANSTVTGAAVQTASASTFIYGTIHNNVTTDTYAGGLEALQGANVMISGATFSENKAKAAPGALYIGNGATVTSENATFSNNKTTSVANAGAIYCAGTYNDTNSTYSNNEAKNGGAIFVPAGGKVTLTGTDSTKAKFIDNVATGANGNSGSRGGAIFVNGGSVSVTGYVFEGNKTTNATYLDSAVHVASGNATLINVTFTGQVTQKVYMLGTLLTYNGLTTEIPENTASSKLKYVVASVTGSNGSTTYFETLKAAVDHVNTNGGTIVVLENTSINETLEITSNIAISNFSDKDVTIKRSTVGETTFSGDMFVVKANASLTLGTNDTAEKGELIIDGATTDAIAGRTVTVESGAGFTLAKNTTLKNANSTSNGAAVYTASQNTSVYGTIAYNKATVDGGGLYAYPGSKVTISGASFSHNETGSSGTGAGLCIMKDDNTKAEVICENATFEYNEASSNKNGGAIYCQGIFRDTNSTYNNNKAKNGGAIFVPSGGVVTLTGTDEAKAIFSNNQARGATTSKGGAIYVNGGSVEVTGYTFTGNTCTASVEGAQARAVHRASGTLTLEGVDFK
ncbi:MAG: right-handed parallel beta-helix repeat-containing protein [Tyzzerella sp.]|nr:right-handed parallel beta-helix repeat-containing protein [Tyzzerella sp.]